MAHDVFISYSHKNKTAADAVCTVLESKGIRCWVAPRDIVPGADWGDSIIDAIAGAKAMVLILSTHSNASEQVKNEVMEAVNTGKNVLPFLIEDVKPSKGLKLQIQRFHWLNAFDPPLQRHIEELANSIIRLYPDQFKPPHDARAPETVIVPKEFPLPQPIKVHAPAEHIIIPSLEKTLTLDLGRGVKLELVLIPAGTFEMGSPECETDRSDHEQLHEVTISKAFYIGKYSVTQKQYEAVTGKVPSAFEGAQNPVDNVSWDDAQEFCKALQTKVHDKLPQGMELRLPTEAQWEYACRAGTRTRFYSGDAESDLDRAAWYKSNSDSTTHPVGQKAPNAFGLYDMHGNVWEFCLDAYLKKYETLTNIDPFNSIGDNRVLRGGSQDLDPGFCRSAGRLDFFAFLRYMGNIGFRVALVSSSKTP